MARTNDVEFSIKAKLINELSEKYSKKAIEDLLGIVIKEVDKDESLYNIYKDGELIFAKMSLYDIGIIFSKVGERFAYRMCEEADKENNLQETARKADELEQKELENERNNYYTCPFCHAFVRRGTHFHSY